MTTTNILPGRSTDRLAITTAGANQTQKGTQKTSAESISKRLRCFIDDSHTHLLLLDHPPSFRGLNYTKIPYIRCIIIHYILYDDDDDDDDYRIPQLKKYKKFTWRAVILLRQCMFQSDV